MSEELTSTEDVQHIWTRTTVNLPENGKHFDDWLASEKNELLWDVTDFVTRHYLDTGVGQAILEELARMRIQLGETQ